MIALNYADITAALTSNYADFDLYLLDTIDSTNQYLKNLPSTSCVAVCCAETQTAGRGRFGRSWHSPAGENIYCSSRWLFTHDDPLNGLSLLVALAMHSALQQIHLATDILIKWPNDLIWHEKKLGGVLVELIDKPHRRELIIGIGLNVNSRNTVFSPISQPWCSLADIHQRTFNRNELVASLLKELAKHIKLFKQNGLAPFINRWQAVDYLYEQEICVNYNGQIICGTAQGIDTYGHLQLLTTEGLRQFTSGETSLKMA